MSTQIATVLAPGAPPEGSCPACGGEQLVPVLEQRGVPVHTSVLLTSRSEALAYATADLRLALCATCGLITNTAFDATGHDYSASYEETQAFSPRFQAFAADLVKSLVDRHGLAGADVFEIGCGRGDFLTLLCERSGGRGFGVDPSFRHADLARGAASRVRIERAFFAADQIPASAAAVICRHTLEHVHDLAGFLRMLRSGLRRAPEAVVFFEVPDTTRILRETAFWDVFYEHCSYFTPGSLARAFRAHDLTPVSLERGFDDQYLLLTARAGRTSRESLLLPLEESPGEVASMAGSFADSIAAARERWGTRLRDLRAAGKRAVIWGAGSKGVAFLSTLGVADEIVCAVDVNPAKHGLFMPGSGHAIVAPAALTEARPDLVIVMNPVYTDEISRDVQRLGVAAEVVAL